MSPQVSVIVPVFNGSRFILNLIDTVRAQTLTDWELIIVDDGSTDDLNAQLAQAPLDARRHLVRQSNFGLSRARNRGLAQAQSDLVAFLDVDDAWQPTYLATLCAALNQAPRAVAAFCGWQYMDAAGQPMPQTVLLSELEAGRLPDDLAWRNSLVPSGLVARRQAVLQTGGFDESMHNLGDWDLWLRLIVGGPFVAVPQALTWYRAHPHSMTENVLDMERGRLKLHAKHLGALDEPVAQWPADRRRAVGFTYFTSALGFFWQNEMASGRERIGRALDCWPGLLDLDEFYYELGCASQPRGLRGASQGLNLKEGEALIRGLLFDPAASVTHPAASTHWGQACLVLARLARDIRQWPACRQYALRAMVQAPVGRDRLEAARLLARSLAPAALLAGLRRERSPAAAQPRPNP
jgi:GT2 family glycosyltransferase